MKVCKICLLEFGEDIKFHDLHENGLKLQCKVNNSLPEVISLKNFDPAICNQCIIKTIGMETTDLSYIKQEPQEFVVGFIKNELSDLELIKDDLLINTDIPECIEDQTYYCHDCSYCTEIKANLVPHIYTEHIKQELSHLEIIKDDLLINTDIPECIEKPSYYCHDCNYCTDIKSNLVQHIYSLHHNIKLLQCDICNFRTHSKYYLKKHMLLHQGRKKKSKDCENLNIEEKGTKVCRICLLKIGEDIKFHSLNKKGLKLQWKLTDSVPKNDVNPVICNRCVTDIIGTGSTPFTNYFNYIEEEPVPEEELCNYIKQKPGVERNKEEFDMGTIDEEIISYADALRSVKEPTYYCHDCGYGTKTRRYLVHHIFKCHRKSKLQCDKCNYSTVCEVWLEKHLATHNEGKPYACKRCAFTTFHFKCLQTHEASHTKVYNCGQCSFISSRRKNLMRHVIIHNKVKPFKCDLCDYSCHRPCHLKAHMVRHSNVKNFKCDKCDYSCARKQYLMRHINDWHSKGQLVKSYKCNKCEYVTTYKPFLHTHSWSHMSVKLFECSKCNYACRKKVNLKCHMWKHTGEKPFKCEKCGYQCVREDTLTLHRKSHNTGERTFKCHLCSFTTFTNRYLEGHIKVHLRKPVLNCEKCDFKTLHRQDLLKHQLTCNSV